MPPRWMLCTASNGAHSAAPASRPPDSILAALTDPDTGGTGNVQSFDSPEDFEAALAAMKGG